MLVRQAAEFAVEKFDGARLAAPAALVASGVRPVTKAVLFPVRFLYTLATGRIGRNDDAAAWFVGHRELVSAAMEWRHSGLPDPDTAEALDGAGETALARQLGCLRI